jgi:hypothetical protein
MRFAEPDLTGWAELRAWQDDDHMGGYIRQLVAAYDRHDQAAVRTGATRLLVNLPADFAAARVLLRRLRDVGE